MNLTPYLALLEVIVERAPELLTALRGPIATLRGGGEITQVEAEAATAIIRGRSARIQEKVAEGKVEPEVEPKAKGKAKG